MPTLRTMTNADLLAYKQLCTICYGYTDTDPAEELDEAALHMRQGVFTEDGRLLSAMMQIPYEVRFCGQTVKLVGVGGVVTDPVARRGGAIRQMFEEGLPRLYREGHVFSALYPFSFRFYGKFGYTWAHGWRTARIGVGDIRADLAGAEEIIRILPGDDDQGMRQVYERYISDKNLAFLRTEDMWKALRRGTPWADQKHAYIMKVSGKPAAYWIGKMTQGDHGKVLKLQDYAWTSPRGRDAMFAMFRGMNEIDGGVEMQIRSGFDLRSIAAEAYDVEEKNLCTAMVRVVNVARALAMLPAPMLPGRLTISVTDGQIPENNGLFIVSSDGYALTVTQGTQGQVDLACDISGLSALIAGRHSFRDALENGCAQLQNEKMMRFAELLFAERRLHINHNF